MKDVAIHTLQSKDGFAGMGLKPILAVWKAFCLADVMEQIYSVILALAKDREKALKIFNDEWQKILNNFEGKEKISLNKRLKIAAKEYSKIELTKPVSDADRITITGEMYVRNEPFCRRTIENTLADMGFITKITPLIEWFYYLDYILYKNYSKDKMSLFKRLYFLFKRKVESAFERKIKRILSKSGLYEFDPIDIRTILKTSDSLVARKLIGDIGITIGVGLRDTLSCSGGIISLGPFACVQTRMAEAILNQNMTVGRKIEVNTDSVFGKDIHKLDKNMPLPYLAIESDGNPYPQIVEARLEVFALQVRRVSEMMREAKKKI
jgi:predicted nucleotide-binding protein (sugar kinase/HSP70/actin superfamily)